MPERADAAIVAPTGRLMSVSTEAHRLPHRLRLPRRRLLWLLAGLAVAAGIAVDRTAFSGGARSGRSDLQRILDGLVKGDGAIAPGATAYVAGPRGSWAGAAGIANSKTGEPMRPDTRLRIQSNSKTWLLAVVLQLADEGKLTLDDAVELWLPGLLPDGGEITIRELLTDTSGLIDDNDVHRPAAGERMLARVKDGKLRTQLVAIAARIRANPNTPVDPIWFIRLAAWQPLLFHTWQPLSPLQHRLEHRRSDRRPSRRRAAAGALQGARFEPLGLTHTSFQPQGPIAGPHAEGYLIGGNGSLTDATAWTYGKGADGAIVSDAADEATFLLALTGGKLHVRREFLAFIGAGATNGAGCPGDAFGGEGAGAASRSYVYYDHTGTRVAVLLLNGFREATAANGDPKAEAAIPQLYCAAGWFCWPGVGGRGLSVGVDGCSARASRQGRRCVRGLSGRWRRRPSRRAGCG